MQEQNQKLNPTEERMVKLMRLGGKQGVIAKKLRVSREHFNRWLNGKYKSKRLDREFEKLYQRKMKGNSRA